MITINVVKPAKKRTKFVKPSECFGAPHGQVFQQWFDGKPQETYLIGAGHCERPITIWWDDYTDQYRLSSESKKDLIRFVESVKFFEVEAEVTINLEWLDVA